jgi:predicted flap endonuclease-1-like 5' DNA nuclease
MAYKVIDIEGVGPTYAEKLGAAGVRSTAQLLEKAKTPKARKALAEATGLREDQILRFANLADLMRIKGVATQMSELLEAAGVDTVKELKTRKPENLYEKLKQVNDERKLTRRAPTLAECQKWIAAAKTLDAALSY